ncbi:MAG: prephenate dehydratase [Planctomycetaceae bacterium]|nr:prephenate dehydratase [Planctomycetaceae bacterium]
MSQSDPPVTIETHRQLIDELDAHIVKLLNERSLIAVDIGKLKREVDTPIYAAEREHRVLKRVRELNTGPLPDSCLEAIYRELMSGSFAVQQSLRVGYLGPDGSFSHLAAKQQFGSSIDYVSVETISDVFRAIAAQEINLGLVPIENSIGGGITETLDGFMECDVHVCAEVLVAIHHNLLTNDDPEQVKAICSRPEVFAQCRRWLADHLRQAELIAMPSSAKAAEHAANTPHTAAIGSTLAADIYNLKTAFSRIEDNPNNVTRFFVIGNQKPKPTGDDKTALMFSTAHKPGALAAVLDVLRDGGINLTHIDKRPSQNANWEYCFFADCDGHHENDNLARALDAAQEHCHNLTVLGSFPRADSVPG